MTYRQQVVLHLETQPSQLLDHMHGTVYLSSSPIARHLSPKIFQDILIWLIFLERESDYCLYKAESPLVLNICRPRRSNFVTIHYITCTRQ